MAQNAIQRKERINRLLSVLLIYALFFQEFIPFARSMNSTEVIKSEVNYTAFNEIHTCESSIVIDETITANDISRFKSVENQQISMAVTGGPGQSESSGFSLGTTDGLVDKFTGDFTYSIPLMSVEGYPIVINYNSNVGMNQDASWVGLGWDLNVGSVSREMRGLPDEFNGNQKIVKTVHQRDNETTFGNKFGGYVSWTKGEIFSLGDFTLKQPSIQLTALFGNYNNTYSGLGKTFDFGLQSSLSISNNVKFSPRFGAGFSIDTKNGIGRNSSFGLGVTNEKNNNDYEGSITYSKSYNSRSGALNQSIGLGAGAQYQAAGLLEGWSAGTSTALTYGSITSIPSIRFNGSGTSFQLGFDLSKQFKKPNGILGAGLIVKTYNSTNGIDFGSNVNNQFFQSAYGYLHSSKRNSKPTEMAVMDFNRSNDFEYSEEMKNLAFSFQTYDIFRANALGMSGTFRARRNDVGTYYDANTDNIINGNSIDGSLAFITGGTEKIKVGVHYSHQDGDAKSGNWEVNGGNILEFKENIGANNNTYDEVVYFKALGESNVENQATLELFEGSTPAYFDLDANTVNNSIVQTDQLKTSVNSTSSQITQTQVDNSFQRAMRTTLFEPKTVEKAIEESLFYVSRNEDEYITGGVEPINRYSATNDRANNHISELEIVSSNGMQYTFGIPAYNKETNQVSFAVGNTSIDAERPVDVNTNLVRYELGDNSISNARGRSYSYDKTKVPAYAHSFLLTSMRSSDYVDIGGDGLSVNDVGSYYKFNHTQYYGEKNVSKYQGDGTTLRTEHYYKWRFPISDDLGQQALHNEGFEGSDLDDMANYTYGEKEIWYTHSVESKNFVAEFYLEDRFDAYGVLDEDGQLDVNAPLKKLSKIVLYNRAERINSGNDAIPLQTIEFTYDYSLCKNAPANKHTYNANLDYSKSGKLTLKEIRVYSGLSKEGGLSKYQFEYSDVNPEFNYAAIDGWGNYKPNDAVRPNTIYPYAVQNELDANQYINAWKLKAINNPIGGRVEVDYEADNYVSVQNQRSMKHIDVKGMTNLFEFLHLEEQSTWNETEYLYTDFRRNFGLTGLSSFFGQFGSGAFDAINKAAFSKKGYAYYAEKFGKFDKNFVPNNVIVFQLDEELTQTDFPIKEAAAEFVRDAYFRSENGPNGIMDEILFKMHVNVKTNSSIQEYIPVFAKISDDYNDAFSNHLPYDDSFEAIGVMPPLTTGGNYRYGYVVVDPVNSGARERKNNKGNDKNGVVLSPIQRSALDFVRQNLPDQVYGSCEGCDTDLSVDAAAFFGGDMYKYMIKSGYVKDFVSDYSTMRLFVPDSIKYGGNARVSKITYKDNWNSISGEYDSFYSWFYSYSKRTNETGVASYEPSTIIDESPFYEWDTYIDAAKKFPDETKFTPTPITGALFPIPSVGYADVRVEYSGGITYGYSKAEYYTAADYPTIERVTPIEKTDIKKRDIIFGNSIDLYGFAQGFVVETNDFHGKPKQFSVHDNLDNLQSRSTYIYNQLDEKVSMMDREGVISEENISMEYDIHADSRFMSNESVSMGVGLSLKFFPFLVYPSFSLQRREEGFFSSTLVKHINRSAVVDRIETEYLNSINTAENMLYDKFTGSVILSNLTDEYGDKLYSMSYPSHWRHDELKDISSTQGVVANGSMNGSVFNVNWNADILTVGDLIQLTDGVTEDEAWVLSIHGTSIDLIDENGNQYLGFTGTVNANVLKSGRKNRLTETMQSVTTKTPIVVDPNIPFVFPQDNILSSSAISYRYKNNIRCRSNEPDKEGNEVVINQSLNPFNYGVKGDLVLDGQFAWQSERVNATDGNSSVHKTRFDGAYSDFIPFYKINSTSNTWHSIDEPNHPDNISSGEYLKWRKLGEVLRYDEYGKAVESEDQINVKSSVLYGFNKELSLLPIAQAVNARQQEIAFDGFEDYEYFQNNPLSYEETHFDFKSALIPPSIRINSEIRHSGLSSLELAPNMQATVTKKVASSCTEPSEPTNGSTFIAEECLCVNPFEPTEGDYLVGAWVKVGDDRTKTTYTKAHIEILITGQPTVLVNPSGPIIDGWQRIEGEFNIPLGALGGDISVRLVNESTEEITYFDDLRIHPFLAGMTTTVYDPKTLLPMAVHDGYNFTTFLNYDENLNQVRVRVETIEGIKTISETEFGGQKSFNNANQ